MRKEGTSRSRKGAAHRARPPSYSPEGEKAPLLLPRGGVSNPRVGSLPSGRFGGGRFPSGRLVGASPLVWRGPVAVGLVVLIPI